MVGERSGVSIVQIWWSGKFQILDTIREAWCLVSWERNSNLRQLLSLSNFKTERVTFYVHSKEIINISYMEPLGWFLSDMQNIRENSVVWKRKKKSPVVFLQGLHWILDWSRTGKIPWSWILLPTYVAQKVLYIPSHLKQLKTEETYSLKILSDIGY